MKKIWRIRSHSQQAKELTSALGISDITAHLLVNRGIIEVEETKSFLYGNYESLHSPWIMIDMDVVVNRIEQAIQNQEGITIYGDYDVDGQTATTLLVKVLRNLVTRPDLVTYYIPHRMEEGYGLHREALDEIAVTSSLVITVDCGISAIEEGLYADRLGLDLIITDHHEPGSQLPRAVGILNPKRGDCSYPFKDLCGAGVAYKLVQALGERYQREFKSYLDLVALGTVADLVPLQNENRILVQLGLNQLTNTTCLGLRALVEVSQVRRPYRARDLGYKVGPRLNALGRMGAPMRGLSLLLTDDTNEAKQLAHLLDQENRRRQDTEATICQEAKALVEQNGWAKEPVIVVASENWHPGVIGIVASRLVEAYYRPVIVIALENGVGKASARSIAGFNLFDALTKCSDLLERFGGHSMAAGLTIAAENINNLRSTLASLAKGTLTKEDYIPKLDIDTELPFDQIDAQLLTELELLEPYGMGNPTPLIQVEGSVIGLRSIGKDGSHLKCQLQDSSGKTLEAVGFGLYQQMMELVGHREAISFAVDPQINPNQGSLQLMIKDMKPATKARNFVEDWVIQRYPWDFPPEYNQISAIQGERIKDKRQQEKHPKIVDYRDIFDKKKRLRELDHHQQVLLYVPTPAHAVELTRQLRIDISGDTSYIGFEHEYLTQSERAQLDELVANGELRWIVTTGMSIWTSLWDIIVFYGVPFSSDLLWQVARYCSLEGELWLLYGRDDRNWLQGYMRESLPDRQGLAAVYLAIASWPEESLTTTALKELSIKHGFARSVSFAIQVFVDLGLVARVADGIKVLPKPAEKLDLASSVLYKNGMKKRELSLGYIQQCLERGLFHEFTG